MKPVRIGCSGWMYDDWRGRLYPDAEPKRRWLELYAERFDTVEVNSTFYRLARRDAVAGWVAQTPPRFVFAVKASRYLTHIRRLLDIEEGIERFYEPLEPLIEAGRLGPVLWQLPENFHRDDARLDGWLRAAARRYGTRSSSATRAGSCPEVLDALRAHGVALTIGDHPRGRFSPTRRPRPGGSCASTTGRAGRRGNYSATELETWARRIAQWRRARRRVRVLQQRLGGVRAGQRQAAVRRFGERVGGSGEVVGRGGVVERSDRVIGAQRVAQPLGPGHAPIQLAAHPLASVRMPNEPSESSQPPDPHHVLNNPATDPDPTEWPDPYDKRPDPRDPRSRRGAIR